MGLTKKLVKAVLPDSVVQKVSPAWHLSEAFILHSVHGFPAKGLKVIGVTGTNGKTTTTHLIHRMLHESGYKVGLMSTVAYGAGNKLMPQQEHATNIPTPQFIKRVKELRKEGIEWLVIEATSHGLSQHRLFGVDFHTVAMTNVTHEHLEYHGTFSAYLAAKLSLFERANKNSNGLKTGVINSEDPNAKRFAEVIDKPLFYSRVHGDLTAQHVRLTPSGSQFAIKVAPHLIKKPKDKRRKDRSLTGEYLINCKLPGGFNVNNVLAAVSVGRALGLNRKQVEEGIAALENVEGRMTSIDEGQLFDVIVDFAHTPDSFEKLFSEIKPMVTGKLIVMFGSAGERDQTKRAVQGKIAGEYADIVVVTEEDNRSESPAKIHNQIAAGAVAAGKRKEKDLFLIKDREKAIEFAISKAKMGDTVLLLGKGHEKTIERKDGEHPWDEIAITKDVIRRKVAPKS